MGGGVRRAVRLFLIFLKIGAFTFGGGYAMIPLIEREIVEKRGLIGREELTDIVAIAESTPGPIAVNAATFVGYRSAGVLGALLATVGVVLPSFLIILAVAFFLRRAADNRYVRYAFFGVRAGVLALIVRAAVNGLPEREQATIRAIYFENKKNKEVAEIYGVTAQAVAEYSKRALMMLRRNKEIRRLSDELGYGSQLMYRNTLGSYKHFGISGVERVAIERADIESRLITASETMRKNDYQ